MRKQNITLIALFTMLLSAACQREKPLFQLLPATETGIHFSNRVIENDTFNILSYEYVYNGGGVGIGDFNNDGFQDVFFTGNMTGNKLYLNQGDFSFQDITTAAGVGAENRWNSGVAVVDINNDGWLDLIITNGFPNDVTDRDFMDYNTENGAFLTKEQLLDRIPSVKIRNYGFRNQLEAGRAIPTFENVTDSWGLTLISFSSGGAYADLDNDGDLDLVINNINDSAFVYKNNLADISPDAANWLKIKFRGSESNRSGLGALVEIYYDNGQQQFWENTPYRGYLSSVENGAHFGFGRVATLDSIVVTWQEGRREVLEKVSVNQVLEVNISNAGPPGSAAPGQPAATPYPFFTDVTESVNVHYISPESDFIDFNVQRLLLHKLSQYGPGLAVTDVNGDKLDDFYLGGSHFNKGKFFIQQPSGNFELQDLLPGPDDEAKREEELGALFFDVDKDGDDDLYLVSGGYEFSIADTAYQDRLFLNENGQFKLAKDALPALLSSGSCVKAADVDRDGDLDLFVGGRVLPHQYPKAVSSYLLLNDGTGKFTIGNAYAAPALDSIGMVCDALWTDFDNDGWMDLLLAGEWMPLRFLRNDKGRLRPHSSIVLDRAIGFWNSLIAADFDLDGDMDYIAGNLGTNTLLKAGDAHPVAVYFADFDGNKNRMEKDGPPFNVNPAATGLDVLPSAYFRDTGGRLTEYPFFGRMDMEKQLVKVKKAYLRHREFGLATMPEILQQFPGIEPRILKANHLKTSYIENLGNGAFALRELPQEAQLAPVYGMVTGEFNDDLLPDLLLSGNDYGTEVGIGRYDALNGLLLLGDGRGGFHPATMRESGICIAGDGKSLVQLQSVDGSTLLIAGQNRGPVNVFKKGRNPGKTISLQPMDCLAEVHLQDGRMYRQELPYGHGFLSQSARRLWLPEETALVEITDFQGNKRRGDDTLQGNLE